METVTRNIDQRIERYMKEQGLSATQMAALLGITTASLRMKRTGSSDWKWSEILALAEMLGVSVDELSGAMARP